MLSMLVRLLRMLNANFSKSNCGAYRLGKDLVNGTPIRQEFLKKALEWMAEHETEKENRSLWLVIWRTSA